MNNDLTTHLRIVFRSALYFLSLCLLVWAFMPSMKPYASGMVLGMVVSMINSRVLSTKIYQITEAVLQNNGRRVNSGFTTRVCIILIGLMVSVKFTQFNITTTIVGMFYIQTASFLIGFMSSRKN